METRASLLIRIKDPSDTRAWEEFHDLYAPLIYNYARARGLDHDTAEEVRSACYESLTRQIGDFDYDRTKGGFKAWLGTLVRRRVVDHWRKRRDPRADTEQLRDAPAADANLDDLWEREWRAQHLVHCVDEARRHVSADQHQAFCLLVREEASVAEVEARLGLNANQIYKAKARVLGVVRELMATLDSQVGDR